MAQIKISAQDLKLVSTYLDVPAETLKTAVQKLVDGLDAVGEPWGDDHIGKSWSTIYIKGKNDVVVALNQIAKGLFTLSTDFVTMSVSYETTEDVNRS